MINYDQLALPFQNCSQVLTGLTKINYVKLSENKWERDAGIAGHPVLNPFQDHVGDCPCLGWEASGREKGHGRVILLELVPSSSIFSPPFW